MLENEKDLAKQKLSSKPAKAAETTETVEAAVQKTLIQNQQNIPRSSRLNDKSKTAKASPSIKTMFQKGPGPKHLINLRQKWRLKRKIFGRLMPILMLVIAN